MFMLERPSMYLCEREKDIERDIAFIDWIHSYQWHLVAKDFKKLT